MKAYGAKNRDEKGFTNFKKQSSFEETAKLYMHTALIHIK